MLAKLINSSMLVFTIVAINLTLSAPKVEAAAFSNNPDKLGKFIAKVAQKTDMAGADIGALIVGLAKKFTGGSTDKIGELAGIVAVAMGNSSAMNEAILGGILAAGDFSEDDVAVLTGAMSIQTGEVISAVPKKRAAAIAKAVGSKATDDLDDDEASSDVIADIVSSPSQ